MSGNTQRLTILAQDPAVQQNGALVLAEIEIPYEVLADGPIGYRVKVVDFDATTNSLYLPHAYKYKSDGQIIDPFALPKTKLTPKMRREFDRALLANPNFHAQQVYAVVMRILTRFEQALGRRVRWGFNGHQLHVAPHAFCDANAFYSEKDRALMFGYFDGDRLELFEGELDGSISDEPLGSNGYGWDQIFIPNGYGGKTRAQLTEDENNETYQIIKPFNKLREFLSSI